MDIDGGGEAADVSSRQMQVRFVTKLQPPYKVQQAALSIPANFTRFGLSALVNKLLAAGICFYFYDVGLITEKLSLWTELMSIHSRIVFACL